MLTERKEREITGQLGGAIKNFIEDSETFGIDHAMHEFHLERFQWDLEEWAQKQTDRPLMWNRGILHDPRSGPDYARDIVREFLRLVEELKNDNRAKDVKIEQLTQANIYFRSHPLKEANEEIIKLGKEFNGNKRKNRQ